jgi:hypothetical protein
MTERGWHLKVDISILEGEAKKSSSQFGAQGELRILLCGFDFPFPKKGLILVLSHQRLLQFKGRVVSANFLPAVLARFDTDNTGHCLLLQFYGGLFNFFEMSFNGRDKFGNHSFELLLILLDAQSAQEAKPNKSD